MRRTPSPAVAPWLLLSGLLALSPAVAEDPTAVWDTVHAGEIDPSRAVTVERLEIDMGPGTLLLQEGVLVPAQPVGSRTSELVFIGAGRFRIDPEEPLERSQLELFTDETALDAAVEQAVLVSGNPDLVAGLLDREPVPQLDAEVGQKAEQLYRSWRDGAERRGFGADVAIWRSLLDDATHRRYFAAWCSSPELGEFYYVLDPGEREQVTLGQFVPIEVGDLDEHRIRKSIKRGQRKGRYRQLRFEDLGDWDTWVSTSLRAADGRLVQGGSGFESEHYELNVTIDPREEMLRGVATIHVRSAVADRRTASFSLHTDLEVESVQSASGDALSWVRVDRRIHIALDKPSRVDADLRFRITWAGKALFAVEKGIFSLQDTYGWYPHIGSIDRATYDVTLRWPGRHELLASGRVVDSGEEKGERWERRTLEAPAIAFSFEIGAYDVHHAKAGHVDLTIGFSKASGAIDRGAKQEAVEMLGDALLFLEGEFGPYPLDHLTVATVPRGFSQGFLSFVTLSHYLVWTPRGNYWRVVGLDDLDDPQARRRERRAETIAHELSHQWWGNKVGWDGYRDQWLSEALADFSATRYAAQRAERKSVYLAGHARAWKATVGRRAVDGRTVESLGPVVMGSRLQSSLSSSAYSAVVYDKGSVVFNMLANSLDPEPFARMLGALATAVDNRVIDTKTFLAAIERMSGRDLSAFADQFIYGTGIPEIYYTYDFVAQPDGTWRIEGDTRQVAPGHYRYSLQRTDSDAWHVARTREEDVDVTRSMLLVRFQVSLVDPQGEETKTGSRSRMRTTTEVGLGGQVQLVGQTSEFSFVIDREPKSFWLDQRGEVLANFFCEQRQPKRMRRYRADKLAGAGKFDEAESVYREALAAPLLSESAADVEWTEKQLERRANIEDARIHIGLSRMYIDAERDAEAAAALDAADRLLTGLQKDYYRSIRTVLRSHLEVRAGNYKAAYQKLSKHLYLRFLYREGDSLADSARRNRFRSRGRWRMSGRAYALLAVAAFETGHDAVAHQATREAERRGAEMDALETLLPAESADAGFGVAYVVAGVHE